MNQPAPPTDMTTWQAAVLGVVQGLTEYIPVSSTGHLLLTQRMMGITDDMSAKPDPLGGVEEAKQAADAYALWLHAGSILAVIGLYFGRMRQLGRGVIGHDAEGRRLLYNLLAAFVPAAVIGLLFSEQIRAYLYGPWPIVFAWFVGGAAILAVVWFRRGRVRDSTKGLTLDQLTWRLALIIGFAQCIAMWPGMSRSLITIVGGVLVGLSLIAAVEFSFLLGMITIAAATVYDAIRFGPTMMEHYSPLALTIGVLCSFIASVVAIKWMLAYLQNHSMAIFGYYRIAIAVFVAALLLFELI